MDKKYLYFLAFIWLVLIISVIATWRGVGLVPAILGVVAGGFTVYAVGKSSPPVSTVPNKP